MATTRKKSARQRFTTMTLGGLIELAGTWDAERRVCAVEEIADFRMLADGSLIKKCDGTVYECGNTVTWDNLPGVAVHIGCDCDDCRYRLNVLRDVLETRGCAATCHCKHGYIRLLKAGHTVRVAGIDYTASESERK